MNIIPLLILAAALTWLLWGTGSGGPPDAHA
jgi:hypothetical protein